MNDIRKPFYADAPNVTMKISNANVLEQQEPCEDCISRQAMLNTTVCDDISCNECSFNTCEDGQNRCLLAERINKLPSVTLQPKTGHWIKHEGWNDDTYSTEYSCSECNEWVHEKSNYCPNCGAKMREVEE